MTEGIIEPTRLDVLEHLVTERPLVVLVDHLALTHGLDEGDLPDDPLQLDLLHRRAHPASGQQTPFNPRHLFAGTNSDNQLDAHAKGRIPPNPEMGSRPGERNGSAKLTREQVLQIRELYASGHRQVDIASRFGVGQGQVSKIIRGHSWRLEVSA